MGGFASIPNGYSFEWGTDGSFHNQFEDVDLAPGETFDFVFGTLTPQGNIVQMGTYKFTGQFQLFEAVEGRPPVAFKTDSIIWNVVDDPKPDLSGYLGLEGSPVSNARVALRQWREQSQVTTTDAYGYYEFPEMALDKRFLLTIIGPRPDSY